MTPETEMTLTSAEINGRNNSVTTTTRVSDITSKSSASNGGL